MKQQTTIREQLPHGAIKRIAGKTGTSPATVNRVIDGKSDNEKVMAAIAKEIQNAKRKRERLEKLRASILA